VVLPVVGNLWFALYCRVIADAGMALAGGGGQLLLSQRIFIPRVLLPPDDFLSAADHCNARHFRPDQFVRSSSASASNREMANTAMTTTPSRAALSA
tara:strand:- start:34860 stop:35150 length:291 start_codon:yes stop_codon:yes gene_type:complete